VNWQDTIKRRLEAEKLRSYEVKRLSKIIKTETSEVAKL
jgi:hypothetical protein